MFFLLAMSIANKIESDTGSKQGNNPFLCVLKTAAFIGCWPKRHPSYANRSKCSVRFSVRVHVDTQVVCCADFEQDCHATEKKLKALPGQATLFAFTKSAPNSSSSDAPVPSTWGAASVEGPVWKR